MRAPVASVFGVLLGVCAFGCGGGDDAEDTTAGDGPTATMTDTGSATADPTNAQPLYGPVLDTDQGDSSSGPGGTGTTTGTPPGSTSDADSTGGTGGQATGTDTGDATAGSESAEPLYGAVMTSSD